MIDWLQQWYIAQCDGDWEHEYGVKIENIDNPGWSLTIDLKGTDLEGFELQYTIQEKSTTEWRGYSVSNNVFKGVGGPGELSKLIEIFKEVNTNNKRSGNKSEIEA